MLVRKREEYSPPVEFSQLDQSELERPRLVCEEGRANTSGYFWNRIGVSGLEGGDCSHVFWLDIDYLLVKA